MDDVKRLIQEAEKRLDERKETGSAAPTFSRSELKRMRDAEKRLRKSMRTPGSEAYTEPLFKNPSNGYVIELGLPFFWCLLFGPFYFMKHGAWFHVFLSAALAVATGGISWVVYPFFARRFLKTAYLCRGWIMLKG